MTLMEKIFVPFGGYSPTTASFSSHEDREPVVRLGMAVAFSALLSAINWGTAGWTFSVNYPEETRLIIAVMAGAISFGLVSVLDASFLYFSDTSEASWLLKAPYGILRLMIILLVSAITSQAVIPAMLRPELEAYALKMAESAESNRSKALDAQFKVTERQAALQKAISEMDRIEERSRTIPPDIQQCLDSAKGCWASYYSRRQSLLKAGHTANEVKKILSSKAATCSQEEKAAKAMQNTYFEDLREQLSTAREAKRAKETELHSVQNDISKRIDHARSIEDKAYSPVSATVLGELLETDRGVRTKYCLVTIFLMVLECLPLILKLIAGRTPLGERVTADRREAKKRRASVMAENDHERKI